MNPNLKKEIIKNVNKLINKVHAPETGPIDSNKMLRYVQNIVFQIDKEDIPLYQEIIEKILKISDFSEKFSEEYISKKLDAVIAARMLNPNAKKTSEDQVSAFIEELFTYNTEELVYQCIDGIDLDVPEVQIGNIKFFKASSKFLEDFLNKTAEIIRSTKCTEKGKEGWVEYNIKEVEENFNNRVVSEYRVVAEPSRAKERAEEETRRALEVLRYLVPYIHGLYKNVKFGLVGEVMVSRRWMSSLSDRCYQIGTNKADFNEPLSLSALTLKKMDEYGLSKLSDLIRKKKVNDYEEMLLKSLHWLSSAQCQMEPENKLLNLIIGLEAVFTPKERDPISNAIAEGVALIIGKNLQQRKSIKKRIKELYQIRSAVSHGGTKKIYNADISEANHFLFFIIGKLIDMKERFSSRSQFIEYIENLKLSCEA